MVVSTNPSFPEVLGHEFMVTKDQKTRVYAGGPARMMELRSTVAETIGSLKMSAAVNRLSKASVPTVIDVFVKGNEFTGLPSLARLVPSADVVNAGWTTDTGATTNLFQRIDDPTDQWPLPPTSVVVSQWIQCVTPGTEYSCSVNASLFAAAGAAQNGRVFGVGVAAILSATPNVRKMSVKLDIGGNLYEPAGGATRDVHAYGQIYDFYWGEINPSTQRPWTPAEIADFGAAGTSRIRVRTGVQASAGSFPRVHALSLNVAYQDTENRVAVGVWRRPESIAGSSNLISVTTDTLRTMPGGTANWAKAINTTYLFYWRQAIAPSEYGAAVGDDVRWNGAYQDLPGGVPDGVAYPYSFSGTTPAVNGMASDLIAYDIWGRPQETYATDSRAAYALVPRTTAPADSVDGNPYRLDLADLVRVTSTQKIGQHMVPGSSQTYLGVRFPIIPPASGNPTLTVAVFGVVSGLQVGGSFIIDADTVRFYRSMISDPNWVYVSGLLSSGAALVSGTAYELRFTTTAGGDWLMAAADCSLAPTISFGGSTSGAYIGAGMDANKDLSACLVRQPNPVTAATAALFNYPVSTYLSGQKLPTVQHVRVSWVVPASGLGASFKRYEVDRSLDGGVIYFRVANVNSAGSGTVIFDDHEAPRDTAAQYRIRCMGLDGRFSAYATTSAVTPTGPGEVVIFTSNHAPGLEVAYFFDHSSSYPILSSEQDEEILIHGMDGSVMFMADEDRGVGWSTGITIARNVIWGKGGHNVLTPLTALIRSRAIPYVCCLDDRGSVVMGSVKMPESLRDNESRYYTADVECRPNYLAPVPVEAP